MTLLPYLSPSPSPPPTLTRWYIDTRPLTASTQSLPLLTTLQESDQTTIKAFHHLSDRHMSLASYLLKYLFIHRTCHVPWNQIIISRTPAPHKRPCYVPLEQQQQQWSSGSDSKYKNTPTGTPTNIEFNVSHQASLIALAGCVIPTPPSDENTIAQPLLKSVNNTTDTTNNLPQIGIDITCMNDPSRRNRGPPKTKAELHAFIDIFSEVFSQNELDAMKADPRSSSSSDNSSGSNMSLQDYITSSLRLFYTYWALKEAYIKMTGEALLAPWLRDLEFRNVVVPTPPAKSPPTTSPSTASLAWGVPETGVRAVIYGREVPEVRLEVVACEEEYIVATAGRGGGFGNCVSGEEEGGGMGKVRARWGEFVRVDVERDVGPCARGECGCLY
ncbi:4'-phosphopantetheinyl transferase NpgA [Paracoccidioides lutzii Pb01]|uniref:holo-[acyl-carrier-protein] synthase n=1 Tax=Paracoccidioides lutzii (strain ATCC MYA-826 / Pb01) TaxID=502779 RepID=C1H9R3_PARBA|nr:4'-phosphopantetheinyl transferase NpgA [Paracoccidioides lutzii Pb01]EEH37086.2 4'-phosphopantetheinyl transferase NpgA [Paracoccidioides lutzii Pb01]